MDSKGCADVVFFYANKEEKEKETRGSLFPMPNFSG